MENKNEINVENENGKESNKKNIIVFVIAFLIIFLIGICFITVKYLLPKKGDTINDNQSNNTYELNIYKYSESNSYCLEKGEYCDKFAFSIETETKDAKTLDINNSNYILYKDNGLKVYDVNNKKSEKLKLEDNYDRYSMAFDEKSKLIGIIYYEKDSEYATYYNLSKNKKMYENKYIYINSTDTSDYLSASTKNQSFLLNANEEKEEFTSTDTEEFSCGTSYSVQKLKDKYVYFENEGCEGLTIKNIYSNDKQVIVKNVNNDYVSVYKDYLYVLDNNVVKKFDGTSKEISSVNTNKDKILQIINNYLIYVDSDNYFSIMNLDDTKEKKQIVKWDENKYTYDDFSTYYSKEELKQLNKDSEEGIYLLLYYKDGKDANGNYGIEYCYTTNKEIKEYPIEHEMGGRAKPVLYLYPTKETKVEIKFEHPEYLTTTYPKYKDKWEVVAKPNGDLYDTSNKYYYALYWDEARYHEVNFNKGFYVTKDNAIDFLEEKLNIIGLNPKEANEFIMYFLPILENNEKSLVYFELTDERELNNKLIITPKPDSMLRMTIHIKKVDKEITIEEQKLKTFRRVGFTAVEWGGMLY